MKRFYLLIIVILALSIPLITFTTYIEVEPVASNRSELLTIPEFEFDTEAVEEPVNHWPIILWSVYGLGLLMFSLRFIIHLIQIFKRIKQNTKQRTAQFTFILLKELMTPHTFFSYIFLNKEKYESQQIPQEVFIHEEAHARQKHSLDILFMELLQILFWFNPLIYFVKHSIKLNHEFLADEAVLKDGFSPSNYQELLLTFSSNVTNTQLAHAINYSSIKKRFTVMKTHTSKQKIWLSCILILPLLGLTLYGFSERRIIEKPASLSIDLPVPMQEKNSKPDPDKDYYYQNTTIEYVDNQKNVIATKKYTELTEEEKQQLPSPPKKPAKKTPLQSELESWLDSKKFGVWVDSKRIKNSDLASYKPSDFGLYYVSKLEKNAVNYGKHYFQVSLYTNQEYDRLYKDGQKPLSEGAIIKITKTASIESFPVLEVSFNPDVFKLNGKGTSLSRLKRDFTEAANNEKSDLRIKTVGGINMSLINQIMEELDGNLKQIRLDEDAYIIGDTTANEHQEKATPEEIDAYNTWAKKIHGESTIISKNATLLPIVDEQELIKFSEIYKRMSPQQKDQSVKFPFPNLNMNEKEQNYGKVNTPYAIEQNQQKATPEEVKEYNKLASQHNDKPENLRIIKLKDFERMEYLYKKMSKEQKANAEPFPNFPPPPPPPPAPKSPLDHVIEMAKKNAKFYYEGKLISSDDAIKLLKENKQLNIATKESDSKEPKVYISKEPIVFKQHAKTKEQVMINGKSSKDGFFSFTGPELSDIELSIAAGTITEFKFKVPGKPTLFIKGNRLNDDAKSQIKETAIGSGAQLFDIKNSKDEVHPPIFVEIK
ncbi:M56 family metallopeptidase [Subsaxibacter sp. CAU 1640]|uniref:M56 family metallopeptidase n=1 Tax=Subsaxibacter sp. CAU 1640 TaxID=2933271 RepID=UPI002003D0CB|nr:M56 family metallopeptidase [Subsaxibacter sp. CAU 1640]MCK7589103.1 M56 family metallopeptidase [Subsaxibacter sp. CAU 1640]